MFSTATAITRNQQLKHTHTHTHTQAYTHLQRSQSPSTPTQTRAAVSQRAPPPLSSPHQFEWRWPVVLSRPFASALRPVVPLMACRQSRPVKWASQASPECNTQSNKHKTHLQFLRVAEWSRSSWRGRLSLMASRVRTDTETDRQKDTQTHAHRCHSWCCRCRSWFCRCRSWCCRCRSWCCRCRSWCCRCG